VVPTRVATSSITPRKYRVLELHGAVGRARGRKSDRPKSRGGSFSRHQAGARIVEFQGGRPPAGGERQMTGVFPRPALNSELPVWLRLPVTACLSTFPALSRVASVLFLLMQSLRCAPSVQPHGRSETGPSGRSGGRASDGRRSSSKTGRCGPQTMTHANPLTILRLTFLLVIVVVCSAMRGWQM
jgi:hypothetical protein